MNNFAKKMMLAATLYHIFAISYYTCHSDSLFSFLKKKKKKSVCYVFKVSLGERGGGAGVWWAYHRGVGVKGVLSERENHFEAHLLGFWRYGGDRTNFLLLFSASLCCPMNPSTSGLI